MSSEICSINRHLLKLKWFYFIVFAGVGCLLPYVPLYLRAAGFSRHLAGTILGVTPFMALVVQPLFGFIADKFNKHKFIMILCCIVTAIAYNSLYLLPLSVRKISLVTAGLLQNSFGLNIVDCMNITMQHNSSCPMTFREYIKQYTVNMHSTENAKRKDEETNTSYMINCAGDCFKNISYKVQLSVVFGTLKQDLFNHSYPSISRLKLTVLSDEFNNITHAKSLVLGNLQYNIDPGEHVFNKIRLLDVRENCNKDEILNCKLECTNVNACQKSEIMAPSTLLIVLTFLLLIVAYVSFVPVLNILDAITYSILGIQNRHNYGKQRLWANISLAIVAALTGYLMDIMSDQPIVKFRVAFYGYGGFFIISVLTFIPFKLDGVKATKQDISGMSSIFKDLNVLVFLVLMLYLGTLFGVIESFVFWFLEEELLNEHKVIPGLCVLSNCISEIFMFYFSSKFIKRLGHLKCMYISIFAFSLRFTCYSLLTNAWFILPVELLNGLTFSLLWSSATAYGSSIVPKSMYGTIQGVLHGIVLGLGKGLGGIVTGQLYEIIGIRWVFRLCAVTTFVVLCLFVLFNCVFVGNTSNLGKHTNKKSTDEDLQGTSKNDDLLDVPKADDVLLQSSLSIFFSLYQMM